MVKVGHGATFGSDMAQVNLLSLDLNLRATAQQLYQNMLIEEIDECVSSHTKITYSMEYSMYY